jgi:L,D-transpeptidase ErfK/SrfK
MRSLLAALLPILSLTGCGLYNAVFESPEWYEDDAQVVQVVPATEQSPITGNRFLLADGQDVVGEIQVVRAQYEDTFVDIARAYGLGYDELVAANPGVDPWIPGDGAEIILPTRFVLPIAPKEGVVLNIAAKRLFYYPEPVDGETRVVETYPVGIGRVGWETPTGNTTVINKARDPVWYVPKSVRLEHEKAGDPLPGQVPPGPDNPLGGYVLGLDIPGYLIHGTNKPAGVGMRVSHGCIRLYPENIENLYERIEIGSRVRIVNQPVLFGWQNGDLLFEAHTPLLEDGRNWGRNLMTFAKSNLVNYSGEAITIDEHRIQTIASDQRGFPVSVIAGGPDTDAQVRNARRVINIIDHEQVASRSIP